MASSFRQRLGASESGNRYDIMNDEGFGGRFQFGMPRLQDFMNATGARFTMSEFLQNPDLQETVQDWHEKDILAYAQQNGLLDLQGQTIGGVPINAGSIIGMAHLGGKAGMKKFIESGGEYDPADSNGTSLSDYGLKFSGTYGQPPEMTEEAQRRAFGLGDTNLKPAEVLLGLETGQLSADEAEAYFGRSETTQEPEEEASFLDRLGEAAKYLDLAGVGQAQQLNTPSRLSTSINSGTNASGASALKRFGIASLV
jgi:hypothetical protein